MASKIDQYFPSSSKSTLPITCSTTLLALVCQDYPVMGTQMLCNGMQLMHARHTTMLYMHV